MLNTLCHGAVRSARRLLLDAAAVTALVTALVATPPAASATPPLYRITAIGPVEGFDRAFPVDINDHGEVLGQLGQSPPGPYMRPFVWRPGSGMALLDGQYHAWWLELVAMNNSGLAVAQRYDARHQPHPFTYSAAGRAKRLQRPAPGSRATARGLNDAGVVVGGVSDDVTERAVVWRPGVGLVDVHPAGFWLSAGHAINRHGDIAAKLVDDRTNRAGLIDRHGQATVFPCLDNVFGDCRSQSTALNDRGQVVGFSHPHDGWRTQAFVWSAAEGTRSLMAGGAYADFTSSADDINDRGEVVGSMAGSLDGVPASGLFRWHAADGVHRLADLIDPADPLAGRVWFILSSRIRINGAGTILLSGWIDDAPEIYSFVLTPVR